jgi:putative hydrolase of the HAD superfamily
MTPATISNARLQGIQWIMFDAVGTLIDPDPTVAVAYHNAGRRWGAKCTLGEAGDRFHRAFRASERDLFPGSDSQPARRITSHSIEESRWRWIVGSVFPEITDPEGCFRDLWEHFARPSSWRCFADVASCLNRLKESGYRLGLASNFDSRLNSICDAIPDLRHLEHRVISASVGFRKPAPEFYAAILQTCGCEPHQILMIGDHIENDVHAPRIAGMQALHLDRDSAADTTDRLRSLTDLTRYLA